MNTLFTGCVLTAESVCLLQSVASILQCGNKVHFSFFFFMMLVMWRALGMSWNTQHCQPSVFSTGWEGGCSNELKELIDGNWRDRSPRTAIGSRSHKFHLNQLITGPSQISCFLEWILFDSLHRLDSDLFKQALSCCSCSHISSTFIYFFVKLSDWSHCSVIWWPVRAGSSTASTLHFFSILHLFWFIYH